MIKFEDIVDEELIFDVLLFLVCAASAEKAHGLIGEMVHIKWKESQSKERNCWTFLTGAPWNEAKI